MDLIVYAADPGSTRTAVSCLGFTTDWAVKFIEHRWVDFCAGYTFDRARIPEGSDLIERWLDDAALCEARVVIEAVKGGAYERCRVADLVQTARAEGELIRCCKGRGLAIELISAPEWRGELCRTKTPSDEQIEIVVKGMIRGFPQVSNEHVRDGAGLAYVALHRFAGRAIRLSPQVNRDLEKQQTVDAEARARKKALGAPKEKRTASRTTRLVRKASRRAARTTW